MNKLRKTLLLLRLKQQCQEDRHVDWLSLHRRDREWFLQQSSRNRWQLARDWLQAFSGRPDWRMLPSPIVMVLVGVLLGVGLMSGLLEFQPHQRINVWWWLLFAVWLPAFWWLVSLWLGREAEHGIWARTLCRRLPFDGHDIIDAPLLRATARILSQQVSLGFALGLAATFFIYLLLTDLAFGWSSTLDITSSGVHRVMQLLATPWQAIWPGAVPSLELIEQSRFFRVEQGSMASAELAGLWWRFLLMNLLCYVVAPRVASFAWAELHLAHAQQRLFSQDACIAGWWQRLHFEQVRQNAEPAPHNQPPEKNDEASSVGAANTAQAAASWPQLDGIVTAGRWQREQLDAVVAQLPPEIHALPRLDADRLSESASSGRAFLLLCKGWEPPTGSIADLCEQMHQQQVQLYIWPAPLPGMKAGRAAQLRESWRLFVPRLPASCHLLDPQSHA
jgi:hypothetical protein